MNEHLKFYAQVRDRVEPDENGNAKVSGKTFELVMVSNGIALRSSRFFGDEEHAEKMKQRFMDGLRKSTLDAK
jgi:hypothetical protein